MPPFSNFTVKAQEAVRKAHELTMKEDKIRLMSCIFWPPLVLQDESMVISILDKLEVDINFPSDTIFENMSEAEHSSVVTPTYQVYITPELSRALEISHRAAQALKDDYVSTEHLFLAILDTPSKAKEILGRFKDRKR